MGAEQLQQRRASRRCIVATVLGDAELTRMWKTELEEMRLRHHESAGAKFVGHEADKAVRRFLVLAKIRRAMFSYSGLTQCGR